MNIDKEPSAEKKPSIDAAMIAPGNSLSGLFSEAEEEENPPVNLIKSQPDYRTHDIVEDLNEIKRIIREWQQK